MLFNPGAFIDVIKCACTDTFQSAFPQCADWYVPTPIPQRDRIIHANPALASFEKTNQTDVLDTPDLPAVVNGIRQVCAFSSSILGNASNVDGETTPSTAAPSPSPTASGADRLQLRAARYLSAAVALGAIALGAAVL